MRSIPTLSCPVRRVDVSAYTVPTEYPESDGTLAWKATTLVLVEVSAAGHTGVGYTYADLATAILVKTTLAEVIQGRDVFSIPESWEVMRRAVRNMGKPGIASMAMAAVDSALWDLKAQVLDLPVVTLLGAAREGIPVYGSGGFTSYTVSQVQRQLAEWADQQVSSVKMKVGRSPDDDRDRVRAAREAIGHETELFVDANGAYSR